MSFQHRVDDRRLGVSWAAATLASKGCTLHPVDDEAWDVELPNGSWKTANNWRELCVVAREVVSA